MIRRLVLTALLVAAANAAGQSALEQKRAEVFAAERAFARSMAERDFALFGRYVADDCVFFSGSTALRGRGATSPRRRAWMRKPCGFRVRVSATSSL